MREDKGPAQGLGLIDWQSKRQAQPKIKTMRKNMSQKK